jgi:hypothetical protein
MGVPRQMFVTIPALAMRRHRIVCAPGTAINSGGHNGALL